MRLDRIGSIHQQEGVERARKMEGEEGVLADLGDLQCRPETSPAASVDGAPAVEERDREIVAYDVEVGKNVSLVYNQG